MFSEWFQASFICPMGKPSLLGQVQLPPGTLLFHLTLPHDMQPQLLLFKFLKFVSEPFPYPYASSYRDTNQAFHSELRLSLRRWEQTTLIISSSFLFSWLATLVPSADRTSVIPLACPLQVLCPLPSLWYAYSQLWYLRPMLKLNLMSSYT